MRVAVNSGDIECRCFAELEKIIRSNAKDGIDDIWIAGDEDYPCLAILRKENYCCIHYFENDDDGALACAKAFWDSLKLPECICWREL